MTIVIPILIVALAVLGWRLAAPEPAPAAAPAEPEKKFERAPSRELESLRPQLKTRIVAAGTSPLRAIETVARDLGAGLSAILVLNQLGSAASKVVAPGDLARWDVAADELFDHARENLRREPKPEARALSAISVLVGGLSTASWILDFDELGVASPHGILVALPNLQTLLYHPIRDRRALAAVGELCKAAAGMFGEAGQAGPISPSVYWLKDGRARLVPAEVVGTTLHLHEPPPELEALFKTLPDGAA